MTSHGRNFGKSIVEPQVSSDSENQIDPEEQEAV